MTMLLLLALLIVGLAEARRKKDTSISACRFKQAVCDNDRIEPMSLRTQSLLSDLYTCLSTVLMRLYSGDLRFPKSCCALPLFNIICNNSKSRQLV